MPQVKQDAVQEIKDRLDLVDLISEHLRLQKAGRDLKGLCPFHQEKTPSLYICRRKSSSGIAADANRAPTSGTALVEHQDRLLRWEEGRHI